MVLDLESRSIASVFNNVQCFFARYAIADGDRQGVTGPTFMTIYDDFKLKTPLVSIVSTRLFQRFNPLTAKLFNLNFHPLEVVSR